MPVGPFPKTSILLEPEKRSQEINDFEKLLLEKVVGQNRAVRRIVNTYQVFLAGLTTPDRPIGNLLFLGPTGSGKTRIVEASAEILFGSSNTFIKIDCAEFQHSHEIAKIVGSPPGYIGHRETQPLLTQENIDKNQTEKIKMTFLLFDEIEKANDALWQLLLGILDRGTLTLGDNRSVDLSRCVIFMTSNLGGKEIVELISGDKIGFAPHKPVMEITDPDLDKKIYRTALEAAKHKFSPEFMNRISKVVVFRTLNHEDLREILDIELGALQNRIMTSPSEKIFIFKCTPEAKEFLLKEGTDFKSGARHLKRAIEKYLVFPLSNLVASWQITLGDVVKIGFDAEKNKLIFYKEGLTMKI